MQQNLLGVYIGIYSGEKFYLSIATMKIEGGLIHNIYNVKWGEIGLKPLDISCLDVVCRVIRK